MLKLPPNTSGVDRLSFAPAVRAAPSGQGERSYLDFVVNRWRLSQLLELRDSVGVFGFGSRGGAERSYVRQLLLRAPSALPSGRVPLYVCPLCGDLQCGTVAVRVSRQGDCVVWSELGWDSPSRSTEAPPTEDAPRLREMWFDGLEYTNALAGFGA
jgi:hypothetical protein